MSDPAEHTRTLQVAPDATRTLIYCPVIHSQVDLGALRAPVQSATHTAFGAEAWRRRVHTVEQMWTEIEQLIDGLDLDPTRTRLYQDGLPICGHELEIVKEMTYKGSRNHRILLRLHSQGATLMGTESGPLLLQEYNLAKRLLDPEQQGLDSDDRDALQIQARTLLKLRDFFIAGRINETLKAGEVGILFLGMLHDITPGLTSDIRVVYPLGKPVGSDGVAEAET
ncbi:hypothetical protein [Thiocapsa rosea]|uniref:Uncharacterized protein n=1 Tax=Thiocapsa rosea TaxID=69360 RepID=A0A495VBV8_9GAMM|nr:hypothetical protein [Thiocapsa rosea]RKT46123.1 hypothetical protein BDD21_3621 [Thiocapsa rosea]